MFRNLRNVLSVGRLPLRAESYISRNAEQYTIRRVRFMRPFFTARRFQKAILYTGGAAGVWHFVLPVILGEEEGEEEGNGLPQQLHDHDKENEDGLSDIVDISKASHKSDEDPLFIPLGWARRCEVKPYKGSDPEWQEFLKFAHDSERGTRVRRELAEMIGEHCRTNKRFSQRLGSPVILHKFWIDIDFPDAPPPEYERSGIEITDDYITWATKPVTTRNYNRLRQALWPMSMSNSFLATYLAVFSYNWTRVKEIFGADSKQQRRDQQTTQDSVFRMTQSRPEGLEKRSNTASAPSTSDSPASSSEASTKGGPSRAPNPKGALSESPKDLLPPLPPIPQANEHMSAPVSAFKSTLRKTWRSVAPAVPRGSIIVSGLVEVMGSKAVCVLDVRAAYNPAQSRWEVVTVALRRFQQNSQAPRGGP
ncbi:hypothetical protein FGG08_004345 [Glutinoglossum americanum]|uniref:Uncharacterized protein n=1 Tax=Glutinoglossum americanum TaxID=1670608 RepID=A0A9P8I5B2_9PEZI|nr:hypothetical protein FGG08_004345 [Glutinoglossum americanum]